MKIRGCEMDMDLGWINSVLFCTILFCSFLFSYLGWAVSDYWCSRPAKSFRLKEDGVIEEGRGVTSD